MTSVQVPFSCTRSGLTVKIIVDRESYDCCIGSPKWEIEISNLYNPISINNIPLIPPIIIRNPYKFSLTLWNDFLEQKTSTLGNLKNENSTLCFNPSNARIPFYTPIPFSLIGPMLIMAIEYADRGNYLFAT